MGLDQTKVALARESVPATMGTPKHSSFFVGDRADNEIQPSTMVKLFIPPLPARISATLWILSPSQGSLFGKWRNRLSSLIFNKKVNQANGFQTFGTVSGIQTLFTEQPAALALGQVMSTPFT